MNRSLLVAFALAPLACSINAPPAEDIQGDALSVQDGRIEIDDTKVPVLTECAEGQVVSRAADAWACVDVVATSVTAGDGLTGGGAGAATLAADFGDGATQVATGARVVTAEADIDALETASADHEVRVADLEGRLLTDLFVPTCDNAAEGGLSFNAGSLQVCDGTVFRDVLLAAPPPALVMADFDVGNVSGQQWPSSVSDDVISLTSRAAVVQTTGPPATTGVGTNGGAGLGAPVGAMGFALPARDFSIEVTFVGSEEILSHGQALRLALFASEPNVSENGVTTRFTLPQAPDTIQPVHMVYVHEADDVRRLYVNATAASLAADADQHTGPYLGGKQVFTLGSLFGAPAGNPPTYVRIVIHGHALSAAEVTTACGATGVAVPGC